MELYAAIDLRGGRCVRLDQGDYARQTVYSDDPVATAKSFEGAGAHWIHVVDLDAARDGRPTNRQVVESIVAAVDVPVQSGGGVRDDEAAAALIRSGVARVVVGTAAVENPDLVGRLASRHPGRVAVGFDYRRVEGRRLVAVRGWTRTSELALEDALRAAEQAGAAAVVVTDIGRDGMLGGPDVEGLAEVVAGCALDVIASGGVSSAADLEALSSLRVGPRGLSGVIVGKAIYEGRVSVEEAVAACAP
ncbi:MAG TPA: 1-(5-phosphoribosyl)-5-[(5-phosphoribosylamino)methylideneamino]imidazole-4-carboxamide isomerase [Acidimicrobiales bacterium]|nr:1-(5-phosphoribosyl)-5-[(5-phosphoribosylamino)methylideneamino]imidazole-4-carboxamide isomerase [Acidimicrobiales bacterium]